MKDLIAWKGAVRMRSVRLCDPASTFPKSSSTPSRARWRIDSPPGLGCQGDELVKAEVGVMLLSALSFLVLALEITVGGASVRRIDEKYAGYYTSSGWGPDLLLVSDIVGLETRPNR